MISLSKDGRRIFWELARKFKQSMQEEVERLDAYEFLMGAEHLHELFPKSSGFCAD